MERTSNGQAITYPKLAGALVESINALLSAGELRASGAGGAVVAIGPALAGKAGGIETTLVATVGGSPIHVRLNVAALREALGQVMPAPAFAALDDDLKLAVLEATLAEPLDVLRTLLGAEVALAGIDPEPVEDGGTINGLLFEVRAPVDVARCGVLVELLAPLPDSVLSRLASSAGPRANHFGDLPVPVTFELGESSLSAAEFGSLESGDVVLFDQCHLAEDRLRVNIGDRFNLVGALDGLELTLRNSP